MIRLSVPGELRYRDVAVRVVVGACRLAAHDGADVEDGFSDKVVSAFGEAFNNVVLHGYGAIPGACAGATRPPIELEIEVDADAPGAGELVIRILDHGAPFDPEAHALPPEPLPERGMGLHIIRSFVDRLEYRSGPPNVLTLRKRFGARAERGEAR
jgi:serine/threonine-protein kinase RsbW